MENHWFRAVLRSFVAIQGGGETVKTVLQFVAS
jgi:hypothetical protein